MFGKLFVFSDFELSVKLEKSRNPKTAKLTQIYDHVPLAEAAERTRCAPVFLKTGCFSRNLLFLYLVFKEQCFSGPAVAGEDNPTQTFKLLISRASQAFARPSGAQALGLW